MNDTLIVCRSITHAQQIASVLRQAGLYHALIRIPADLADTGCGYAVRIREDELGDALRQLHHAHLSPLKILVSGNGIYREVIQ